MLDQACLVLGQQTRCVNYQIVPLIASFFITHYLSKQHSGESDKETEMDGFMVKKDTWLEICVFIKKRLRTEARDTLSLRHLGDNMDIGFFFSINSFKMNFYD